MSKRKDERLIGSESARNSDSPASQPFEETLRSQSLKIRILEETNERLLNLFREINESRSVGMPYKFHKQIEEVLDKANKETDDN